MELSYHDYCADPDGFRQRDLTVRQVYDADYLRQRYAAIDLQVRALSALRLQFLEPFALGCGKLLDFGCGTGRFVELAESRGWDAWGHDLAPGDGRRCTLADALARSWDVATFFDSLEHLVDPAATVKALGARLVMVSVPECHFPDLPNWFMRWKHRRPGEHLWHWNRRSLGRMMARLGYFEVMASNFEDVYRPNPLQAEPNILTGLYRRPSRPQPLTPTAPQPAGAV
jgi:SAM-dependent methyltransferase